MSTARDFPSDGIEEWWDDYARSLRRRGRSDQTILLYRRCFCRFWQLTGLADPADVTTSHVNRFVDQLRATGIEPSTVAITWRNTQPFFGWWARETGGRNPFTGADRPGEKNKPPPVIDLADIRTLVASCKSRSFEDRRDEALIRTLFDTGCRLGELTNLELGDWDRRNDYLALSGKTGPRVVPISASTGEAMARYLRLRARHPFCHSDAMWVGRRGRLTDSGVEQMLATRSRKAGLPRLNPHRFRHTFAHLYRSEGGSEGDLLYLAGWSTTAMAHRYGRSAAGQRARDSHRRLGLGDKL